MKKIKLLTSLIFLFFILGAMNCSQKQSSDQTNNQKKVPISVSWDANRESAVNKIGGGYQVYYSQNKKFKISRAQYKDVPYISGDWSPTSTKLELYPGTWYIKVVAYSGLGDGFYSKPSDEEKIIIK